MRHSITRRMSATTMRLIAAILLLATSLGAAAAEPARTARININDGNRLFREKNYSQAEAHYRKALAAQPENAVAQYNLALTLLRQKGALKPDTKEFAEIAQKFARLAEDKSRPGIAKGSALTLGNMYYRAEDYQQAINMYKSALRLDPNYDTARENLRLAQLKQKDQDKNKDKNQNQDQDQDKNQNQNQDQNKDQNQNQNQNQPPQAGQQQLSDANAERILKEMQNREAATLKRLQEHQQSLPRKPVTHPW